ncbi:M50 family metallopeptidase [bacterium]|nr:M50 family metallopeptidase [bacterium]
MAKRRPTRTNFKQLLTLIGMLIVIGFLWNYWPVYPLKILVVFFHELSHGLMAVLTGGRVHHIELVAMEGGVCYTQGGNLILVASAGYLGSLLWGGAILLLAVRTHWDKTLCIILGSLLLVVMLIWIRPLLSFGFGFTLLTGAALIWAGIKLSEDTCDLILKLVGLVSMMYVPMDIFSDTLARSYLPSDARVLSQLTLIPSVVWGVIWLAIACAAGAYFLVLAARITPGDAQDTPHSADATSTSP